MPALTMPNIGEGVTEGTVTKWLKREGDDVALDEPVVEVETDKAVVEIPSPFAGRLTKIIVDEGGVVPVGEPLAEFETSAVPAGESPPTGAAAPAARRASPAAANGNGAREQAAGEFRRTKRYSPVVLKLAAEHDIDLSLVRGTGIEGRVTKQDVLRYIENPVAHSAPPSEGSGVVGVQSESAERKRPEQRPAPESRPADVVPLSATRRTIAERMSESHRTIPVAWMVVEADVTGLVARREQLREEFEQREGVRLTFLPFFVEATAGALRQHPALNASFTDEGIRRHRDSNLGIAVATESGLLVPVLRNAGDLSLAGIARQIAQLGEKARTRKLAVEELRGATFTLDNTGAFGSIVSQPIVPAGQVAIMTTEAMRRELRVGDGDSFAVRWVMNLCISFDHRALDGAEAGAFMQSVKAALEQYAPEPESP